MLNSTRPKETPSTRVWPWAAAGAMGVLVLVVLIAFGTTFSETTPNEGDAPPVARPTALPEPTSTQSQPQEEPTSGGAGPEAYPFADDSVWRESLRDAPVNEDSDAIVEHLAESVASRYDGIAAFNASEYNAAYYVVGPEVERADVSFDDCQDKGGTPSGLYDGASHFADVPIPDDAEPAEGRDGALVVYAPDTDQLWEFWRASETDDGWSACWGGRIDDVSTNPGHFDGNFGTTATGLPHAAGMVSLADVRSGSIEHAVALLAAEPAKWDTYSWPAQRSDGWSDDSDAVPEGMRLRLDDDVDVASLGLHPLAEMVAFAAQDYGFIVVDQAGATGVYTESGAAEEAETGEDPWPPLLGDVPSYRVMEDFPWEDLEALPMDYGKP